MRARARNAPPRLLRLQQSADHPAGRHATWTELFFDLVFVVGVAQLASGLHQDVSAAGAGIFLCLFVPAAWTWTT